MNHCRSPIAGCGVQGAASSAPRGRARRSRARAFTLTEMLIVIGIILIVALISLPIFSALTGSNSTESAQNQLSGVLGRSRAEAIGLQQVRGVAFFIDRETQQVQAVQVKQTTRPIDPAATAEVYLDFVEDRDPVLMPLGVGLQMVDDCALATGAATPSIATDDSRADDGYIGFNVRTENGVQFSYGGVILFDGYGRIVTRTYGYNFNAGGGPSNIARAFEIPGPYAYFNVDSRSQFGFVVYNSEAFTNNGFDDADPQIVVAPYTDAKPSGKTEADEETWLDENATPVLVNRNNGTLVKGK